MTRQQPRHKEDGEAAGNVTRVSRAGDTSSQNGLWTHLTCGPGSAGVAWGPRAVSL